MGTPKFNPARWLERASAWAPKAALIAIVWFFVATVWEVFGPLPGGHLGNATGAAIAGENMLQWHVFGAVLEYTSRPPVQGQLYCHHPYGVFVAEAISHAIFGHGWASVRLPAIVMSALTPWLLYLFARSLWGVFPAAIATAAFTLIPIDLAFSSFSSLEVMVIFFGLLFSWATARLWQTWRAIYIAPAAIGALGACHSDWVGLVLVGVVGVIAFVRVYLLTPSTPVHHARHARWFAWSTAAAVTTLVLYLAIFAKAGKLGDLLSSAESRSTGATAGWRNIFGQRRVMWVLMMLPVPALVAIVIGPIVSALRAAGAFVDRRRPAELIAVAWMIAASVQYFVFRQGADVHIFWPHYFGVVAALGFGVIAEVVLPTVESLSGRTRGRAALSLAPISLVLLAVALTGRVGVVQLAQSRLTGGRFDDGGRYIAVDQDRAKFVQWAVRDLPPNQPLALHRSFVHAWSIEYAAGRPIVQLSALGDPVSEKDGPRYALVDARYATATELRLIASKLAVVAVGPYWRVDRTTSAPLIALRYDEHQPNVFERYFVTGTDLVRKIGVDEDPWQTWAWREMLGGLTEPPAVAPSSAEDALVAYNIARSNHDDAASSALRRQVESLVKRHSAGMPSMRFPIRFDNDLRLIGVHVQSGAATVVTLLWETGPAFAPFEGEFLVRSRVLSPPILWTSAIDFFEKETAPPMWPKVGLWKPDHLYLQRYVDMRRVGTERFEGLWSVRTSQPPKAEGRERVELFTLP